MSLYVCLPVCASLLVSSWAEGDHAIEHANAALSKAEPEPFFSSSLLFFFFSDSSLSAVSTEILQRHNIKKSSKSFIISFDIFKSFFFLVE